MSETQIAPKQRKKDIQEEWRGVFGYEPFYEVSSLGRIRRRDRITADGRSLREKVLIPVVRSSYLYVTLCGADKSTYRSAAIHRLVCAAFRGCEPFRRADVNHLDGDKFNNTASNLEWTTRSQNQRHAADIGLKPHGERSHLSKLRLPQVVQIRETYGRGGISQAAIASDFGVSQTCIGKIVRGEKWRND
jgi:hypothetical protein